MKRQAARYVSLGAFIVASVACGASSGNPTSAGDGGAPDATSTDADVDVGTIVLPDAGATRDATAVADGEPLGDEGPPTITVAGHAVDQSNTANPLAARGVVLLDANGTRTALTTDSSGAFEAAGIVPPYDAMVAAGADVSNNPPVAYLGLTTEHPQLGGLTDDAPCVGGSATVEVPIQLPACSTSGCVVSVAVGSNTVSSASGGYRAEDYMPGPNLLTANIQVTWCAAASVVVNVNVLASDFDYLSYFYGSTNALVTNGATVRTVTVTPTSVPTLGMTTISASSTGIPAAWGDPLLVLSLAYPSNGGFASLPEVQATSVVIGVPDILGATLSVQAQYGDPVQTDNPRAEAEAVAASIPLSTSNVALAVEVPPTMTSPASAATLPTTGSITWTALPVGQVAYTYLSTTADAGSAFVGEVITGGEVINLARLALLGLSVAASDYDFQLYGKGNVASLDAIVDEQTLAVPDGTELSFVEYKFTIGP